MADGRAFVVFDRLLDVARTGPLYLRQPALAEMVTRHLVRLAQHDEMYGLHAFAVMPNHVHLLLTPNIPFPRIARLVKGATARWANQLLGTAGQAFWQEGSYDHRVKDRDEWSRIRRYIELNPVRSEIGRAHV
jgi:REP element-mobilizing transposase RayT